MNETPLSRSLDYLAWPYAFAAILEVFRQNQRAFAASPATAMKASADLWCTNSVLRTDVWQRMQQSWCRLTSLDLTWFPYSEDGAARLYFRVRKRSAAEVDAFEAEARQAVARLQKRSEERSLFPEE